MRRKLIKMVGAPAIRGTHHEDGYVVLIGEEKVVFSDEDADGRAHRYAQHRREREREKVRRRKGKHHA